MGARTVVTADGVRLAARIRHASDFRATVVVAHGFASSAAAPAIVSLTDALHRRRFTVVTYDARGHGASGGWCTLGRDERLDVAAVTDVARTLGRPVVLVGISMGAVAVLHHAAEPPTRVRALVTVSAPARWTMPRNARGALSAAITYTRLGRRLAVRRLSVRIAAPGPRGPAPVELAARVPVPLAVVHGARDPFIPASNAVALHAAAMNPAGLTIVPGRWHAHDAVATDVVAAEVDALLSHAPSRHG